MNAYQKAVSLNLTGTSEEKVNILKYLTIQDIPVIEVAVWLRENLLWYSPSPSVREGALEQIVTSNQTPIELKQGLGILWSSVFGSGAVSLRTSDPYWSSVVSQILNGIMAVNPSLLPLEDSFYEMGGGRPYKDVTVEDFEAQKATAANRKDAIEAASEMLVALQSTVSQRAAERQAKLTPIVQQGKRETELVKSLETQIAVATNGGILPTLTQVDIDAVLEGN